jgi:hypothetical protein
MARSEDGSVLSKVSRILGELQLEPGHRDLKIHCRCGWVTARTQGQGGGYHKHRRHQAEVLQRAGLLWDGPDGEGS